MDGFVAFAANANNRAMKPAREGAKSSVAARFQ
jgi:hypothetical protein